MASLESYYLPPDRRRALSAGIDLPSTALGSALFADISGFTPIAEKLRQRLGVRGGAETLAAHLNRVYDALIAQVEAYGGSVIGFAGDAITCWFDRENAALAAAQCAGAMVEAMQGVEHIALPDGETGLIGLKVSIASGAARRFVVGDPAIQLIDVLAGATVARMAGGEELAERGEIVADEATVERLGNGVRVREWREHEGQRFAVLEGFEIDAEMSATSGIDVEMPSDDNLRPWVLPALARHLQAGSGEFLIELRPTVALFLRFSGIDYDDDSEAEEKLNRLVRLVQGIVSGYDGNVIQLTIGDKGSYLYASFGAPFAHEDDAARALNAAIDIREGTGTLDTLDSVQIGLSQGMMRTGAYGSTSRRTYGVLGDEVNVAARLMSRAEPGTILMSETVMGAKLDGFRLDSLPPLQVKGKANPIQVYRVIGRRERSFEERFYTTPLVGREVELEALREAIAPIWEGRHAGVIYLHGEPGMGKSRLAFEIQKQMQAGASVTWLTGQADGLNRTSLGVFAYLLRPYFGQQRERTADANRTAFDTAFDALVSMVDEATQADLRLSRSFLAGLVGLVMPGSPYDMADEKLRVDNGIIALKAFARAEGRRQPLVFHLEDAQWLDTASISAIQQLTYNVETVPLVFVLTSRYNDDNSHYTIPDIFSVPIHSFDLNRLRDEGVRAVAEAVLHGKIGDGLARFIYQQAEGNPFFTEQLALDLKERGVLVESDGWWDIHPDTAAEVPSGVNAVLIARLDRLAAQVKTVVQTAAVLGREFDVLVLSQMLREGERGYIKVAESEAIWTALDALRYLFRHALLRDAAYAMQVQERLKALHYLAAETIEQLYPQDTAQYEALLEHWRGAGVVDKMLSYTGLVCQRLVEVAADYGRAERLLQQGLAAGESPWRAAFLRLLGDAMQRRGQYVEATAQYEACLAVAGEDVAQHIQALDGLGKIHMEQSDYAKAAELSTQALELARRHQDRGGTARALMTLGDTAFQQGDYPTALAHYSESLQLYRELGERTGIVSVLSSLGKVATIKSDSETARTYLEECLALCREMGEKQRMGLVLNNLGNLALSLGDFQATRSYYESSLSVRREIGDRYGMGGALGNLAILTMRQGKPAEALEYGEASLQIRREIGDRKGIANALSVLATAAYYQSDYDTALHYMGQSLEMVRAVNDRWGIATMLYNMGELARTRGDLETAQGYFAEGLMLCRELKQPLDEANVLVGLALVAHEHGEMDEARGLYQEALSIRRDIADQRGIANSLVQLAILDREVGDLTQAESCVAEALPLLRTLNEWMLSPALAIMAVIKRKNGAPAAETYPFMREALTTVQAKGSLRVKLFTLLEAVRFLLEDGQYRPSAELIGLLLSKEMPTEDRTSLNRLLDDLRLRMDTATLEAALEQGKTMEVDAVIEHLLSEGLELAGE